ncbi:uncharacterized protein CG45076 isoform X21 [Cherax quadricarinatus]|uniref:uncharacterized protein CG45076 isoform X21 n=1 Tax=Cherax quadricarinatus TaxID=27406 RepID=UPI002379025D|nr:uncharacterized abhydrolase domain-containing protein DDB_G0269086-like isoform X21 [Cherax quadricarinatus]
MMRGPSYDDSYISRKITQMPGPTFNAPGPVSYGRPPIGGYIQDPYGYDYIPRRRKTKTTRAEARSLSPEIPYLWPEVDNSFMERKARKGWYRVDFGPHRATETRYLPTTRDRLNFLRRYAEPIAYSSYSPPRASSVPPPVKSVKTIRYPRYSSYWTTPRYHSSVLIPYRRPRSISYSYWYYPTLGPYSGRLWTSARHLSPLAGRARSLSPVRVSTSWSDSYTSPYSSYSATTTYSPDSTEVREERRSVSPAPASYRPSAATQLILNRVALRTPRSSVSPLVRGYPQFGPPPPPVRIVPRLPPPSYYDYGGYYSYVPLQPRISRYDSYLDDELPEPAYIPRYRPRVADTLDDADFRERSLPHLTTTTTTTTTTPRTTAHTRGYSPGAPAPATRAVTTGEGEDSLALVPFRGRTAGRLRPHLQSLPRQETVPGETEGERHLARLAHRYPSLSEPQMLQDHVDKMRIRLKSLAYSLDPTGPVPEIILPERHKKSAAIDDKKYSSALEFNELPKLASRRQRYYPEDEHMKDNLRIQCLSHYKTTRTAADAQVRGVMPDTSSRYTKLTSKWEEPDTVFGAPSDKKPYSKAITDGAAEEGSEEKKERRKKKKSKEREVVPEVATVEAVSSTPAPPAAAPAEVSVPEAEPVSAPTESEPAEDEEKERKRLEKKKRKAEREAAAKAAMEAELAALAAAEAELARLEAESSSLKPEAPAAEVSAPAEVPAAPAEPAAEVKSESAAEKSSEPSKAKRKLQSATSKILAVGAFFRSNKTQKQPSAE